MLYHYRSVVSLSYTARDLLQKIARDAGLQYREVAKRVNLYMGRGKSLLESLEGIASESNLDPSDYKIDSMKIFREAQTILEDDYSQTLMISAVLAQMVEVKGKDRFPAPAFFAFLEILSTVPESPRKIRQEPPDRIDENTTRMIELTTTLVSLICDWSAEGIKGVAKDCPEELRELAKTVLRKTKLLQSGMWTCVSCGNIVEAKETHALMCSDCDTELSSEIISKPENVRERERTGYGQTTRGEPID